MPIFTPRTAVTAVGFRKASADVGTRDQVNFHDGTGMTVQLVDQPTLDRMDVTLSTTVSSFREGLIALGPASLWPLDELGSAAAGTLRAADLNAVVNGTYTSSVVTAQPPLTPSSIASASFASTNAGVALGSSSYAFAGVSPFTWAALVNVTTVGAGNGEIVWRLWSNASGLQGYRMTARGDGVGSGTYRLTFSRALNGSELVCGDTAAGSRTVGTTYLAIGSYDGASLRMFVSGVQAGTTIADSRSAASTTGVALVLGNQATFSGSALGGYMDELAVFTRGLTLSDAASLASLV